MHLGAYSTHVTLQPDHSDPDPPSPKPASQVEPPVLDTCLAARIGDAIDFANCLVKAAESCPHGFVSGSFHYCVHPHREKIIARTLPANLLPRT